MHTCTEKTNWLPKTTTGLEEGVLALLKAVIPESSSALSSEYFIDYDLNVSMHGSFSTSQITFCNHVFRKPTLVISEV